MIKKNSYYLTTMTRKGSQIKFITANDTASGCLLGIRNWRILGQLCIILWLVNGHPVPFSYLHVEPLCKLSYKFITVKQSTNM